MRISTYKREATGAPFFEVLALLLVLALMATVSIAYAGMIGSVTGTGADLTVSTGLYPQYVKVVDNSTGYYMEWYKGMAADTAYKTTNAVDGTSRSFVAYNGITPLAPVINSTNGQIINTGGFIVGADPDVNVNGHTLITETH